MFKRKSFAFVVFAVSFILSLSFVFVNEFLSGNVFADENTASVLSGEEWVETTESGETVYTATGSNATVHKLTHANGLGENNLVEFDLRINSSTNGDDGRNVTLVLTASSGDTLKLSIQPCYNSMYFKWSDHRVKGKNYDGITTDGWNKVTVKVAKDYVYFNFAGTTIEEYYTSGIDFTNAKVGFSVW